MRCSPPGYPRLQLKGLPAYAAAYHLDAVIAHENRFLRGPFRAHRKNNTAFTTLTTQLKLLTTFAIELKLVKFDRRSGEVRGVLATVSQYSAFLESVECAIHVD